MDIFAKMEDVDDNANKSPKELIKELMKQVEEEYGMDDLSGGDDGKADEDKDDTEHEIVGKTLKDAVTAEDAQWQEIQIDGFLSAAAQHQNIQIAKKLMQDTALTKEDVAQITGVDPKLLADYVCHLLIFLFYSYIFFFKQASALFECDFAYFFNFYFYFYFHFFLGGRR